MRKLILFISILMGLTFNGCKDTVDDYNLRLNFEGNYLGEKSWVLIQSLDFSEVYEFEEISGASVYVRPDIESYRVNLTIATMRKDQDGKDSYQIFTYYDIPTREWFLKGDLIKAAPIGNAKINVKLKAAADNNIRLSTRYNTIMESTDSDGISFDVGVNSLDLNNKFSALAISWSELEQQGFYAWLDQVNFNQGGTNTFNLAPITSVLKKNIRSSSPIEFARIDSYAYALFGTVYEHSKKEFNVPQTAFSIYYGGLPDNQYYYATFGYNVNANMNVHRHYLGKDIPEVVDVGQLSINGKYNAETQSIENIQRSELSSFLIADWEADTPDAHYLWEFNFPKGSQKQDIYMMPAVFFDALGINKSDFKANYLVNVHIPEYRGLTDFYRAWFGRSGYFVPYDYIEEAALELN